MEIAALTSFLAPFLPYLLKAGTPAAEEAGKLIGAEAWELAKALWKRLRPRLEENPTAEGTVHLAAERPDDTRARGAFELQLEMLLGRDHELREQVTRLWQEAEVTRITTVNISASGDRSVAAQTITGSHVVTGDQPA